MRGLSVRWCSKVSISSNWKLPRGVHSASTFSRASRQWRPNRTKRASTVVRERPSVRALWRSETPETKSRSRTPSNRVFRRRYSSWKVWDEKVRPQVLQRNRGMRKGETRER